MTYLRLRDSLIDINDPFMELDPRNCSTVINLGVSEAAADEDSPERTICYSTLEAIVIGGSVPHTTKFELCRN